MFYRNGRMVFSGMGGIGGQFNDAAAGFDIDSSMTAADYVAALRAVGAPVPQELLDRAYADAHPKSSARPDGALVLRAPAPSTPAAKTQQSICSATAQAIARGNPAAAGLFEQCNDLRAQNVASGQLVLDGYAVNGELREQLVKSGQRIAAADPKLAAAASRTTVRGFFMGIAVARAAGADPGYAAAIRASLSAVDAAGFDSGLALAGVTQQSGNGASSDEGGIPRAVIIGGAAVGVLAVAAAIYKFTR